MASTLRHNSTISFLSPGGWKSKSGRTKKCHSTTGGRDSAMGINSSSCFSWMKVSTVNPSWRMSSKKASAGPAAFKCESSISKREQMKPTLAAHVSLPVSLVFLSWTMVANHRDMMSQKKWNWNKNLGTLNMHTAAGVNQLPLQQPTQQATTATANFWPGKCVPWFQALSSLPSSNAGAMG